MGDNPNIIEPCDVDEQWLAKEMNKETTLADIPAKMQELEDAFTPIKQRAIEYELREDTIKDIDRELSRAGDIGKKIGADMPWVPKEDLEKAEKKITEFSESWDTKKKEQAEKKGWEEPVFTKD